MLKFVVFMSVFIALSRAMSDEMKELIDSLHKTCIASTGATEDVVAKAQKGDFTEDENLKCYMKCTLDEVGVVEDDGKIDVEGMIAMLPDEVKDILDPIVRKCVATNVGANVCDTVFLMYKCTFKENPSAPSAYFRILFHPNYTGLKVIRNKSCIFFPKNRTFSFSTQRADSCY